MSATGYEPSGLEQRLRDLGWRARVGRTTRYFVYGEAKRAG